MPSVPDTFCPVCGLESVQCASEQSSSWEGPYGGGSCCRTSPMLRLPLLDVDPVACAQSKRHPNGPDDFAPAKDGPFRWSIREILTSTDPSLMFAVRCITAHLKLSCFPETKSASFSVSGVGVLGSNGSAITPIVEGDDVIIRSDLTFTSGSGSVSLASCAVLAIAVREFARCLVTSAVTAYTNDRGRVKGSPRAVLTPAHVSRGVAGSFLTRGVLAELPTSPVALALVTLVQQDPTRDPSPDSVIMETSYRESASAVHSLSHCALDDVDAAVEG